MSVFGSETRVMKSIAPKIRTKNYLYVPYLIFKFHVSAFSRFKVKAFSTFGCQIRNFARKNSKDFRRKASRKSQ